MADGREPARTDASWEECRLLKFVAAVSCVAICGRSCEKLT